MFHFLTNNLRLPWSITEEGSADHLLRYILRYCPKTAEEEAGDNLQFKFATQDFDFKTVNLVYNFTNRTLTDQATPGYSQYYKLQGYFVFTPSWHVQEPEM